MSIGPIKFLDHVHEYVNDAAVDPVGPVAAPQFQSRSPTPRLAPLAWLASAQLASFGPRSVGTAPNSMILFGLQQENPATIEMEFGIGSVSEARHDELKKICASS
jgi:hypothetical protein